jgi:NAD(P)-dependent dehydrogenase (short-subunit alcohol dehydrogenase family)
METRYLRRVSLRRMVSAEDVAAAIAFLMSDAGRNLSTMSFNVDGNVKTL